MSKNKNTKTYVAYGSNMDLHQMDRRCPGASVVGTGRVPGYRLLFKGSMTGSYATIEPCEGAEVPVLLWEIDLSNEQALDRYEGFPILYQKCDVAVETENGEVVGMVYVMDPERPLGEPSESYYGVLERAYERFGFDKEILEQALDDSMAEAMGELNGAGRIERLVNPAYPVKICGNCGYFALEPFKRRGGACLGSYDKDTATYHATSWHRTEDICPWCPGWIARSK